MQTKDQKHHWKSTAQSIASKLLDIFPMSELYANFVTRLSVVLCIWDSLVKDS